MDKEISDTMYLLGKPNLVLKEELNKDNIMSYPKIDIKYIDTYGPEKTIKDVLNRFDIDWIELYMDSLTSSEDFGFDRARLIKLLKETILQLHVKQYRDKLTPIITYYGDEYLSQERKKIAAYSDESYIPAYTIGDIMTANTVAAEQYTEIFKHFVWQMKRKALDLKVNYHLVPILTGEQGVGKSTLLDKMFLQSGVMHPYFYQEKTQMSDLNDDAKKFTLYNKLFCGFEEFKFSNNEQEKIKALVTSDTDMLRRPYAVTSQTVKVYTSFMATSNKMAEELISDQTGARRFYSVKIDRSKDEFQQMINGFDFAAFFRSIDPFCDGFYTGQTNISKRISFIDFLAEDILKELYLQSMEENNFTFKNNAVQVTIKDNQLRVRATDITGHYEHFCKNNNFKYGKPSTRKELIENIFEKISVDVNIREQLKAMNIINIEYKQVKMNKVVSQCYVFTFDDSPLKLWDLEEYANEI
jgi:hypothetical protein